jgi:tetratricopeptide (TPR) repeat protein
VDILIRKVNKYMGNGQTEPEHKAGNKLQTAELVVLAVILLTGLFLRGSYLLEIVKSPNFTVPMVDAAYHDYWARGLATGDWSVPANRPDPEIRSNPYLRPPGYPYFLALVYLLSGCSFLAARIVQMLIGLANCVLAYILGRSLFGRAVGLILAGFMSVYWAFIFFEGELLGPVLIIFCALCLMNILYLWTVKFTYSRGIAAGVFCGLFALFRPNILLFVPVVLLWAWWLARRRNDGRRFRAVAVGFLVSTAVVIAPVTLRNYLVADDFALICSNAGVTFYIGNNEESDCVNPRIPELQRLAGRDKWGCFEYPQIVRGVSRTLGRPMKHSEVSSYFAKKAIRFIYEHPLKALGLTVKKALLFWGPTEISNNKELLYEKQHSVTLRCIPGFPVFVSAAFVGLLQLIFNLKIRPIKKEPFSIEVRRQLEMSLLIILFIGTYFISFLPFIITARYRVPIIPFLLLFGAYGLYSLGRYIRSRDFRGVSCWAVVWILSYVLATRQFVPYEGNLARWHYYQAGAYSAKGQIDLAIEEYRKALRVAPALASAHQYLAMALERKGNLDEAVKYYYSALRLKPDLLTARFNLGIVLYQQDKNNEAINHWIEVIKLNPYHADAHNYLGMAFYKLGSINKAVQHWTEALDLKPDWTEALNNLAWVLAAVDDENLLNPAGAVRLAERAAELTGFENPDILDTLSVAYAAAGRFPEAVQTAQKALYLTQHAGDENLAKQIREHLELFKAGQPFIKVRQLPNEISR